MCILLIILIVVSLYYFLQNDQSKHMSVGQNTYEQGNSGDALEILRQRYAQGEIDEVEYKERKRLLESR